MEAPMQPDTIVIDDLSTPRFSPEAEQLMAAAVEMAGEPELTLDAVLAAGFERSGIAPSSERAVAAVEPLTARAAMGADDAAAAVDRLDALLAAFRDAPLSPFGKMSIFTMLTQMVANRILIERAVLRAPDLGAVAVERPVVIVGLQRSGTTHLHNLLASDPALRSLPYWESLEPVPHPDDVRVGGDEDPRIGRCRTALDFQDLVMPHFKAMHEMTEDHAHEEIQLMAPDFETMLFEAILPLPAWRDAYLARDQRPSYAFMKRCLGILSGPDNARRWVLKSPQHLEQIPALRAVFPDGAFVFTHRDPVPAALSMMTMAAYSARMHARAVDLEFYGEYWADRTERMLRASLADRESIPAEQRLDVGFDAFMADPVGTVAAVYDFARQPFSVASRKAVTSYAATHGRGRYGRVVYDAAAFGLTEEDLARRFSFYTERLAEFGVR